MSSPSTPDLRLAEALLRSHRKPLADVVRGQGPPLRVGTTARRGGVRGASGRIGRWLQALAPWLRALGRVAVGHEAAIGPWPDVAEGGESGVDGVHDLQRVVPILIRGDRFPYPEVYLRGSRKKPTGWQYLPGALDPDAHDRDRLHLQQHADAALQRLRPVVR